MKKYTSVALLAAAVATLALPAAGAAVDSGDAQAYLKAMDNRPNASSYLVDFDGDGSDELILTWHEFEQSNYEVWEGAQRLVSKEALLSFSGAGATPNQHGDLFLTEKDGVPYLYEYLILLGDEILNVYTVQNGAWTLQEDLINVWKVNPGAEGPDDGQWVCTRNGEPVSHETFTALVSDFKKNSDRICGAYVDLPVHSVYNEVLAALSNASDSGEDVLNTLSSSEKTALFDQLLSPFAGYNVDYRTATDPALAQLLSDVSYDHDKAFPALDRIPHQKLPNEDFALSKSDADRLTQQLFGRTLDFSKLTQRTVLAAADDLTIPSNSCYVYQDMLCFHEFAGMGGFPGTIRCTPQHLYALGNGYFAASMLEEWFYDDGELAQGDLFYSVVKKNADGSYRLIRTYQANYIPSDAELAAFAAPSSWAQAEVSAADAAGLIPALDGDPSWQDSATRLQFAQLAVRLAETLTGETLPAAPASTFADCSDLDVRKAYAAGIVNGTSQTTYTPDQKLTREQLATMLWRTAAYIQQQTGEQRLTVGGSLAGYTDAGQVSAYAREAVATLAKYDVMQGTSATKLSPQSDCTVEQSVLLAYRMMQALE